MQSTSPSYQFALEIVRKLRAAGHTALFAGGCVRDALLGREPKDYDVATTAHPDEVRSLFGHRRTLAVGASFGVIMVLGPKDAGQVEVATFRSEGPYLDGRRPTNVVFCAPEDDARRRDFTINGMFFDPVEEHVLDYVGGEQDLRAGVVRAIGNPHDRVREDKLRMLRAVRFSANLDFALDPVTADAVREMSSELVIVSAERIAQELKKMLVDRHRRRAVTLAEDLGLIRVIFPELDPIRKDSDWNRVLHTLALLQQPSFELCLAVLLLPLEEPQVVESVCRRLKLSNDEIDRIKWLVIHRHNLDEAPTLSLASLKRTLAHPYRDDLLEFMRTGRTAASQSLEPYEFCQTFLLQTPADVLDPVPFVTGDDLIRMGLKPGPRFKSLLLTIRDAQLNLELTSRAEALRMVESQAGN